MVGIFDAGKQRLHVAVIFAADIEDWELQRGMCFREEGNSLRFHQRTSGSLEALAVEVAR